MPPRKRGRAEQPVAENERRAAAATAPSNAARNEPSQDRREAMAQLARRRAAHFANFKEEDDTDLQGNIHAGGDEARTLGPWSSAVELVNNRAKAQAQRADQILAKSRAVEGEAIEWEPSRDVGLGAHPRSRVEPLHDICLKLLTEYIDCVESLVGVPEVIRVRLAQAVCIQRRMDSDVAHLFVTEYQTEIMLPDCTQLDKVSLSKVLEQCDPSRLERLELAVCGRGFTDAVATHWAKRGPWSSLSALTLGGAYCMDDDGLLKVLKACPKLQSLSVPQASRLSSSLDQLPALVPQLKHLNIQDCRGITADSLVKIVPQLVALQSINVDGIPEANDQVMKALAKSCCLRSVSIGHTQVTDDGLAALALARPQLEVLRIDSCIGISDKGLTAVADSCKHLQVLSVRCCSKLSDDSISAVVSRGSIQQLITSRVPNCGAKTMQALALNCANSLEQLDVSFCRLVTESALGLVADTCTKLECLKIFGCSQIGPKFLYGHSNELLARDGSILGVGTTVAS